jgi:hypothetical protein
MKTTCVKDCTQHNQLTLFEMILRELDNLYERKVVKLESTLEAAIKSEGNKQ